MRLLSVTIVERAACFREDGRLTVVDRIVDCDDVHFVQGCGSNESECVGEIRLANAQRWLN